MKVTLDLNKSAGENANDFFKRAKKLEAKAESAVDAVANLKKRIAALEKADAEAPKPKKLTLKKRKWYEKFRWFETSEGNLVIGGRDATTNEIAVKKHSLPDSTVFHADITGSPFFVAPSNITPKEIMEVATATASYSRAWKMGIGELEVYYVKGEQVSKTTKSGEFMGKGSFMIYGSRNFTKAPLEVAVGFSDKLIAGPTSAISNQTKNYITVTPGHTKPSAIAKHIKSKLKIPDNLDEVIRCLPPGDCDLKENRR